MSNAAAMSRLVFLSACLTASFSAAAGAEAQELSSGTRIAVGRGPADMVFSADGKRLYVTENADNSIAIVDVANGSVLRRVGNAAQTSSEDGCGDNFCRGMGAVGVAVDPGQQRAYASSFRLNALTAFDLRNGEELWNAPLQRFPQTVLLTPDGAQAWVFNMVANSISVVDTATGKPAAQAIQLEGGDAHNLSFGRPLAFAMARDGRHVYAGSVFSRSIDVFDTRKQSRSARIESAATPYDLTVDATTGNIVGLFDDGVVEYAAQTLAPLRAYRFCNAVTSWNIALSADGRLLALTFPKNDVAFVVARDSGLLTHVFRTDAWPSKLAFSPDSRLLAVLNAGATPSVSLLDVHAPMNIEPLRSQLSELFCQPNMEAMQWMR